MEEQKQRIKGLWPWFWPWQRHSSGSAFLWSGPGRRTSVSRRDDLAGALCGNFVGNQRRVQPEGCAAEPLTTITAILSGSKWSCLLLCTVLQDAFE